MAVRVISVRLDAYFRCLFQKNLSPPAFTGGFAFLYCVTSGGPDGPWEPNMQEGDPMIEFKHVSKTFHGKKIIDDISFQIPDGEFVVL